MIPPDSPQSSQTLELSQTPNQDGIAHVAHLIEETKPSNSQDNTNYDTDDTEYERQNPELKSTRVFGQGKRPRQANKSKSTIPGLTPENLEQELQKTYDKVNQTEFTRFIWKKVQKHEKATKEFKTNNEMCKWVRSNLKYEIIYKQSIHSRLASAGKMII